MTMKVGLNIGNETISIEYKEFCFQNLIKYFNSKELYNLIYNYESLNKLFFRVSILLWSPTITFSIFLSYMKIFYYNS